MVWFLKKIQIKTGKFQQRNQYLEIYRTQYLLSIEVLMHGKKWENLKSEHCIYSCRICNVTQQEQTLTKKNKTIANYHISIMKGQADDHYFAGGVLESLLDDPEGFSIQGVEEYYSKQEIKMLEAIQRKLKEG